MRIVTRGDLDGLASSVIIGHYESVDEIVLVHPQDVADGRIAVTSQDILANVPYAAGCGLWFDHHVATAARPIPAAFEGRYGQAPSAASLVWEHYGRDPRFEELVEETSRLDSARLTESDVLDPRGYVLLGYTLDGRSGLGPFEHYFHRCVKWVASLPIDQVLAKEMVVRRVRQLRDQDSEFRSALEEHSRLEGNVIFTDFRSFLFAPVGNRFLVYLLYPEGNVSVRVHWGPSRRYLAAAVAHSIFDPTCQTDIGELMGRYGGGGLVGAGGVPLPLEVADDAISEIVATLQANG